MTSLPPSTHTHLSLSLYTHTHTYIYIYIYIYIYTHTHTERERSRGGGGTGGRERKERERERHTHTHTHRVDYTTRTAGAWVQKTFVGAKTCTHTAPPPPPPPPPRLSHGRGKVFKGGKASSSHSWTSRGLSSRSTQAHGQPPLWRNATDNEGSKRVS